MRPHQSTFAALRIIVSFTVGGALIAAIAVQIIDARDPGSSLLVGCLIGSAIGLLASFRPTR